MDCTWDDASDVKRYDYLCIGTKLYDDHSVTKNGVHQYSYYLYPLPDIEGTDVFQGEDVLLKTNDPNYDVINDISYSFQNGVLTFRGRGMVGVEGTTESPNPWDEYAEVTTGLVFEDGITKIAPFAFKGFTKVETVELADSISSLGQQAFDGTAVREVVLPAKLSFLDNSFSYCYKCDKVEKIKRLFQF